jgi:hypothetical protein
MAFAGAENTSPAATAMTSSLLITVSHLTRRHSCQLNRGERWEGNPLTAPSSHPGSYLVSAVGREEALWPRASRRRDRRGGEQELRRFARPSQPRRSAR